MICVDCRYIRERPSGIGLVVQELVSRLPRWMPDQQFLLLRHPKAPARLSECCNTREVIVGQEANGPATMWWLSQVVDLSQVRLFHAPFNILPAGLTMPTLVTVHDVMWLTCPRWAQSPGAWGYVERFFYQHGIWRALRQASHICAISQATSDQIARLHPPAKARTTVLMQAVSSDFEPVRTESQEQQGKAVVKRYLGEGVRFVLTVGQFVGYKNHPTVVRAFAQAFRDEPDVHLVLIQRLGEGPRQLKPLAEKLGIGERVHFLPTVPLQDLVALYQQALCLCHPSFIEGFGLPLVEALACGCPVVTSNRSAMPEVCSDAAVYVDPGRLDSVAQGLRRMAVEPGLREKLRDSGLKRVSELSWDRYARGYMEIYRRLLEAPPRAAGPGA